MAKYNTICIIVAAGSGLRFGEKTPKQYLNLAGKPMLSHSVSTFSNHPDIDAVQVVYNPQDADLYNKSVKGMNVLPPVAGGKTRQESVRLGLEAIEKFSPKKVLIHDAARPLVTSDIITRVIAAIDKHKAIIPALHVEDTLKKTANGKILHTINRSDLMRAQTPQGFVYEDILESHRSVQEHEFTDDSAIEEHLGNQVTIIEGSQMNFKITTNEDLKRAEKLMEIEMPLEVRTGTGFDVHKFCQPKLESNNFIMLCGVKVPHHNSLEGHSDADVGLHSIVDALLGTICAGDIGEHFPPSDAKYKGMASCKFLEHTKTLLDEKSAKINNIDVTIICEKPKISPFKNEMRETVAKILAISPSRVSIKATTTEGLGFTGRKEGIAAQAIATITLRTAPNE